MKPLKIFALIIIPSIFLALMIVKAQASTTPVDNSKNWQAANIKEIAALKGKANLKVKYYEDGQKLTFEKTIKCPKNKQVCKHLMTNKTIKQVDKNSVCTKQYGGPQRATIKGTFKNKKINVTIYNSDGCQMKLFDKIVRPILENAEIYKQK